MKKVNADAMRATLIAELFNYYTNRSEDVGYITSGAINFPVVSPDGEEGWVEVVVKLVKDDEGYEKRADYVAKRKRAQSKEETK